MLYAETFPDYAARSPLREHERGNTGRSPSTASAEPPEKRVPDATTLLNFRHLLEQHKIGLALFAKVGELLLANGLKLSGGDPERRLAARSVAIQVGQPAPAGDLHRAHLRTDSARQPALGSAGLLVLRPRHRCRVAVPRQWLAGDGRGADLRASRPAAYSR